MSNVLRSEEASLTSANRRLHSREKVGSLAYVDLGPAKGGMVLNLSEGGLALTAAVKLVGDELPRVRFELPNVQDWIEARGRIVWRSESKKEAGIKFEELPDDALQNIRKWLSAQQGTHEEDKKHAAQDHKTLEHISVPDQAQGHDVVSIASNWFGPAAGPGSTKEQPSNTDVPQPLGKPIELPGFTAPLGSPGRTLFASSKGRESILERWGRGMRTQMSEQRCSGVAVIIALVALISFATGILIDRRFKGFPRIGERKVAEVVQQAHNMDATSSTPAPEKASSAGTQAYDQRDVAFESSVSGSSLRSGSSSTSDPLTSEPKGVADKDANPASVRSGGEHGATTWNIQSRQGALTYDGTRRSAAAGLPTAESNTSTPVTSRPATFTRPTEATKATSLLRPPVQPQISDAPPRVETALVPHAVPTVKPNETRNPLLSTDSPATSPLASPSITITLPPFPSIRVSPTLRSQLPSPGTSLQMGQLTTRIEPAYPTEAARQRIEGTVKLHAIIGRDGAVQSVVATGPPLLAEAATTAVRQWRYKPTVLGGQAIEAEEDIVVVFRLSTRVLP